MSKRIRVDGAFLGRCACGCDTPVFEKVWLYPSGGVHSRERPRYISGHHFRVVGYRGSKNPATMQAMISGRRSRLLPIAHDVDRLIRAKKRELGWTNIETSRRLKLGSTGNVTRYARQTYIEAPTLHRILDALFESEGGWVESAPVWALVRSRQALWEMTDAEMEVFVGTSELRWIGKATAAGILRKLTGGRPACAKELERSPAPGKRAA